MDEAHWGLTARPFQLTPDPHFWYEPATHKKAMFGAGYEGVGFEGRICGVSILRAGEVSIFLVLIGSLHLIMRHLCLRRLWRPGCVKCAEVSVLVKF